jgi:hypothetical protein
MKEKIMSYLDVPRLHFAGNFIAQPSTLNNTGSNFDPAVTNPFPSWNPNGNHYWQFLNCTVQTVVNSDGSIYQSPNQDPIIGAAFTSTDNPTPAKLVDLDTEQQLVSQIWGLQIKVAISETDYFVGNFRVVPFNDIKFGRSLSGGGDAAASAYFQSVLDEVEWGGDITSPFLQELQKVSRDSLSIKFVVDGYNENSKQGRIVGTIGPARAGDPPNFLLGRALRPNAMIAGNELWYGYARVDKKRQTVLVDFGNSIPTTAPGGPPPDLGTLQLAIIPPAYLGAPIFLGVYDYSEAAYLATAGIQEFPVNEAQLTALASTPLGLVQTIAPAGQANPLGILLQEGANGTYINATQIVYRLDPGDIAYVKLIALQFGEPAANQLIALQLNPALLVPQLSPISANPPQPGPVPMIPVSAPLYALTFPSSVTTDKTGSATFQMAASDPGNPRGFIDGQVYGVGFNWAKDQDPTFPPDPNGTLSVLVFDSFVGTPTWETIQPFMAKYAKLYPYMDSLFKPGGLGDITTYQQNVATFQTYLNFPITDTRYMPVTRDMSRDKRKLLQVWLDAGAPGPTTKDAKTTKKAKPIKKSKPRK